MRCTGLNIDPPDLTVDKYLQQVWTKILKKNTTIGLPKHSDALIEYVFPLLPSVSDEHPPPEHLKKHSHPDLFTAVFSMAEQEVNIGVGLFNYNARWLGTKLEELNQSWNPTKLPKVLLIRDEGWDIPESWKKSHDQIKLLKKRGGQFTLLSLSHEQRHVLHTLKDLYTKARNNELVNVSSTITDPQVLSWIKDRLRQPQFNHLQTVHDRVFAFDFDSSIPPNTNSSQKNASKKSKSSKSKV